MLSLSCCEHKIFFPLPKYFFHTSLKMYLKLLSTIFFNQTPENTFSPNFYIKPQSKQLTCSDFCSSIASLWVSVSAASHLFLQRSWFDANWRNCSSPVPALSIYQMWHKIRCVLSTQYLDLYPLSPSHFCRDRRTSSARTRSPAPAPRRGSWCGLSCQPGAGAAPCPCVATCCHSRFTITMLWHLKLYYSVKWKVRYMDRACKFCNALKLWCSKFV